MNNVFEFDRELLELIQHERKQQKIDRARSIAAQKARKKELPAEQKRRLN